MRLKPNQSEFVARKIAIDLVNAPFVKLLKGKDAVVEAAKKVIDKYSEKGAEYGKELKSMISYNHFYKFD